jgi:hypothetical protein
VYSPKELNALRKKSPLSTRLGDLKGQFLEKIEWGILPWLRKNKKQNWIFGYLTKRIPLGSFQIFSKIRGDIHSVSSSKELNALGKKNPFSTRLGDLKGQFHEKIEWVILPWLRKNKNKFEFLAILQEEYP